MFRISKDWYWLSLPIHYYRWSPWTKYLTLGQWIIYLFPIHLHDWTSLHVQYLYLCICHLLQWCFLVVQVHSFISLHYSIAALKDSSMESLPLSAVSSSPSFLCAWPPSPILVSYQEEWSTLEKNLPFPSAVCPLFSFQVLSPLQSWTTTWLLSLSRLRLLLPPSILWFSFTHNIVGSSLSLDGKVRWYSSLFPCYSL